ncbi:MAG: RNA methyltransferase [Prevotellaceae bacterium]|jgi:TrmH family RNA methyltransferase|nr:RNA methyltransferase [Prevotellaceae bacterium]
MLSNQKIKLINSLSLKKYRDSLALFVAEGTKCVLELSVFFDCKIAIATQEWLSMHKITAEELVIVSSRDELKNVTALSSPPDVLAIFYQRKKDFSCENMRGNLTLMLDDIQDPGNLGTLIRLADWFGCQHIICSPQTVDVYNSKVIQATMGAIARVNLHYTPLDDCLQWAKKHAVPVYGTFLNGENIYATPLTQEAIIVFGNEGHGISPLLAACVDRRITIPRFPAEATAAESLNVAMSAAIVLSEFRRNAI